MVIFSTFVPQSVLNLTLVSLKKQQQGKRLKSPTVNAINSAGLYLRPGIYFPNMLETPWFVNETGVYSNPAFVLVVCKTFNLAEPYKSMYNETSSVGLKYVIWLNKYEVVLLMRL